MVDVDAFLDNDKSMITAPAGYGKTHTIIDCLKCCPDCDRILILTHTHAGVASIKEKIKQEHIRSSKYYLDTICGFALDLVNTYMLDKSNLLNKEDPAYFSSIIDIAANLLRSNPVISVLSVRFVHLIVDEYQDCTLRQHCLIMNISKALKTHILGDPMQGIFNFNDKLVDLNLEPTLEKFRNNQQILEIPWRWKNAGNELLGLDLSHIRNDLELNHCVDLNKYENIDFLNVNKNDLFVYSSDYQRFIDKIINESESLLLIHPMSTSTEPRLKIIKAFGRLQMIESLDDKKFYSYCNEFDTLSGDKLITSILNFCRDVSKKSVVDDYFNGTKLKKINKRTLELKRIHIIRLQKCYDELYTNLSLQAISQFIEEILQLPNQKCYRKELYKDVVNALKDAFIKHISAFDAISIQRDKLRHSGRKILGRSIGTTLLTKGLEFDAVLILNAHEFESKEHLYVALTRCCKKLFVTSETSILKFSK